MVMTSWDTYDVVDGVHAVSIEGSPAAVGVLVRLAAVGVGLNLLAGIEVLVTAELSIVARVLAVLVDFGVGAGVVWCEHGGVCRALR